MEEATGGSVLGTPGFLAPEKLVDRDLAKTHKFAADIWCLGETTFQLLVKEPVFSSSDDLEEYYHGRTQFPTHRLYEIQASPFAIDFIVTAMAAKPGSRLNASQAVEQRWITNSADGKGLNHELAWYYEMFYQLTRD